jgi:hypothetical protein
MTKDTTVGMELGDTWSVLCVLDAERSRTAGCTRRKGWTRTSRRTRAPVVLELGTHSPWVSRLSASRKQQTKSHRSTRVKSVA